MINFLKLIRIHQWLKNLLIFLPLLLSLEPLDYEKFLSLFISFFIFSAICSGNYIFNDLIDYKDDISHPINKKRPIASGNVGILFAKSTCFILFFFGFLFSFLFNLIFFYVCVLYLITAMLYTYILKKIYFIDILVLALFYLFRIFICLAILGAYYYSTWVILFLFAFFLSLATLKRILEVKHRPNLSISNARPYKFKDFNFLNSLYLILIILTVLIFIFYGMRDEVDNINIYMFGLSVSFLLFWCLYIYGKMVYFKVIKYDPFIFAITDYCSLLIGFLFLISIYLSNIL